jgi:transposase
MVREKVMVIRFSNQTVKCLEKELTVAEGLNNLRLYKIILCLVFIHKQKELSEITQLLNVGVKTIYNWRERFLVDRFSWLLGHHFQGRGRKPRLNKEQKGRLYQIVEAGPEKYGFKCGIWNSAMLVEVIQKEFKVTFNPRYLCSLLNSIGLTFQRAKFVSDRVDEDEHQKQLKQWNTKTWPAILKRAQQINAVILFGDEVSFAQWGSLARTWAPRGKQPVIKTSGKRKGLKMFGVIEFHQGGFEYMECEGKFNGDTYVKFLQHVLNKYACPVILIEDGAPYHQGRAVNKFKEDMAVKARLFVYRLPSYSPDKNPIEKLWKKTKAKATHLKYFPKFDDLRTAVIKVFKQYLKDATEIIAVMKKLRLKAGIA